MNISAYSIKNPLAAILFFVLFSLLGVFGFLQMKVQQFPDIDLPGVVTTITLTGASVEQLESEIAIKVENRLANIEGIKNIRTTLQTGVVTIFSEFELEKPNDEALDDVRSAVGEVQAQLPAAADTPIISKVSTAGMPVATYSVAASGMSQAQLSWFVDDTLTKQLSNIAGVGKIERIGGVERQILVQPKLDMLSALTMPIGQLSQQIFAKWQDTAGGEASIGNQKQTINIIGAGGRIDELKAMQITTPQGTAIRLDNLATISDTHADISSLAQLDDKQVVAFSITRSKGAGEVEVVAAVDEAIKKLQAQTAGLQIEKIVDYAAPIKENYQATMRMLIEGCILAVLVVFVFLRDWRATLVAATALPLSIIPTFFVMYWFGFSLNMISLLALTLVIGVLVDDAIVEIENIVRHLAMGKTPMQAAIQAADEIGLAVMATTFTLIAVFLPTAFMSGVVGQFFSQFGWTAVIAIFISLMVARLLTPMMAAYLLKPAKHTKQADGRLMVMYLNIVKWTLNHRALTIGIAAGLFVISLGLAKLLPTAFIPADEMNQTRVSIELSPDATIDDTLRIATMAQQKVQAISGVQSVLITIGAGQNSGDPSSRRSGSVNVASLQVRLVDRNQRISKAAIESQITQALDKVPSARFAVGISTGGGEAGYVFSVMGTDKALLDKTVQQIMAQIRTLPMVAGVMNDRPLPKPELGILPDTLAMADKGVTTKDLSDTLRIATLGDYDQALPKLNLDTRQIPIVTRLGDTDKQSLNHLQNLYLPSTQPLPVQLKDIAQIRFGMTNASISRLNRERAIKITVLPKQGELGALVQAVKATPTLANLPQGIRATDEGQAENMAELFTGFVLAMSVGVFCIFAVLMLLFHRVLQPLTILVALPLSIGGAFIGLLLTGSSMSMPAMIGFILLMGIATKNSILLVDYAITAQDKQGLPRFAALIDACRKRAQPIIMTTIAMGAGMLPLIIGLGGVDSTFSRPMAVAVLGGLITSTLLSLVVIPVFYALMDDLGRLLKRSAS
ncbi:Multidrug efflux pump subunit AcrB [Moraxella cuniculi DSM 21768]|uniref:Multidrug efflux pump subunit AcrB n=1 Tax=Moraxella cuniculi DSM 21768 TaxID=1122245 RepID=A0A1N7DSI3_9GAMM|nr:efflux RND transporter permease subunit [Moraxella cuniculi]OOS07462.1 RND transporter [Moraxella cuniculi]SIR78796.1 Multidrug efflux pump subunit AcrB [Moraxella cuniculi DSM 21768]